jgi:glucose-1-phosphate adenylyltransferase
VPFGGRYRIIDFVLSNLANSGIRSVYVLTQYKSQSLAEHVQRTWGARGHVRFFRLVVPAQMRMGESWYRGTADSVFQNLHLIEEYRGDAVLVFGADHIYKMNIRQMTDFHFEKKAIATIACLPIKKSEANQFGIVQVDDEGRVVGFQEKPDKDPHHDPGRSRALPGLDGQLRLRARPAGRGAAHRRREGSRTTTSGRDILPSMLKTGRVFAYNFGMNRIRGVSDEVENAYWRDVGTIDAYYEANMDLKNVVPSLNLYNWDWPIITANYPDPPAKLVFDDDSRRGVAIQSVLSGGCIIAGGFVKDSVLGRNVFVDAAPRSGVDPFRQRLRGPRRAHPPRHHRQERAHRARRPHRPRPGRDALRHTVSEGGVTVVQKARDTLLTRSRNF